MTNQLNVHYHYGGTWIKEDNELKYVDDIDRVVENYDPDFLSYTHIVKKYKEELYVENLKNILALQPGKSLTDGLFLLHDDETVRRLLYYINRYSWVGELHFYEDHDLDVPIYARDVLAVEWAGADGVGVDGVGADGVGGEGVFVRSLTQSSHFSANDYANLCLSQYTYTNPRGYVIQEIEEEEVEEVNVNGSDDESDLEGCEPPAERVTYSEGDGKIYFQVGMTFGNANEVREAFAAYGIEYGYKLKIKPNEPKRLGVKCMNEGDCPFKVFISKDGRNNGLVVKTLTNQHTCLRHYTLPSASVNYLAKHFKAKVYRNPDFRCATMKEECEKELKINVSLAKCKRAKKKIKEELDGSFKAEFSYLAAYAATLKSSNPGTKAEIQLCNNSLREGKQVFKRIFVCFDACKRGWLSGCRPIIGLDGCFLKVITKGQLLTAVGLDADDQVFPIAWAVIDKENKDNWRWFLCWLSQELDLDNGKKLTLISDMQKGLIDAAQHVLPEAEHRWCARHILANWGKKWHGGELKKRFWICAWSTFEEEFKDNLKKLGEVSKKAASDLMWYPPQVWCRAYFSSRCQSYIVDNNISESFNSWIIDARHKPIISMLEEIRLKTMNKIKNNKALAEKWYNN